MVRGCQRKIRGEGGGILRGSGVKIRGGDLWGRTTSTHRYSGQLTQKRSFSGSMGLFWCLKLPPIDFLRLMQDERIARRDDITIPSPVKYLNNRFNDLDTQCAVFCPKYFLPAAFRLLPCPSRHLQQPFAAPDADNPDFRCANAVDNAKRRMQQFAHRRQP